MIYYLCVAINQSFNAKLLKKDKKRHVDAPTCCSCGRGQMNVNLFKLVAMREEVGYRDALTSKNISIVPTVL